MKKKAKVRLQDIAERANLSISAVSLALRDHPSISEESKRRIQQIRRELGYRPTSLSQNGGQAARGTLNLGYCLIGESLQDEAYTPIAHGIIKACREWQAHLAIEQLPGDSLPASPITMPTGEQPDGYLLVGFLTDAIVDYFASGDKPLVLIGSNPLSRQHSTVTADIIQAGSHVAERAIADGYRNFLNIGANLESLHNIHFLKGVRRTLAAHGFSLPDDHVIIASEFALHEPQHLDQIAHRTNQPTAILTAGAVTATACASILQAKGWMQEKKIGIYALRPSDAGDINPHYKSLNLGFERLGQIAVDRLVQKIQHHETYRGPSTTVITAEGWLD